MGGGGSFIGDIYDSTIGEITGSNRAADSAGRAAQAQEDALGRAVDFAQDGLDRAQGFQSQVQDRVGAAERSAQVGFLDIINRANSPQELRALTQSLENQQQSISRQQELFASIDPAVMEASQQALQLLQGEEARSLAPLKKERASQRRALVDRLREQLGPGAETSTAGMQALNSFDDDTSALLSNAQQQGISQLFGIAQTGAQGRSALNQGIGQLANIGGAFGQRAGRMSNASLGANQMLQNVFNQGTANLMGAAGLEQGAFANLINAQSGLAAGSGSEFVAEQLRGQAQNQFVNDRIQAGEQMVASFMGSEGGDSMVSGLMGGGGGGAAAGGCCFIFLEARYGDGTMDSVVRKFRDEHMTLKNKRGYYKLSEVLIPLMRKSKLAKGLVRVLMTDPLVAYGRYHYGQNKWGKIFKPVKNFWLNLFDYLGEDHPYVRENGEVV